MKCCDLIIYGRYLWFAMGSTVLDVHSDPGHASVTTNTMNCAQGTFCRIMDKSAHAFWGRKLIEGKSTAFDSQTIPKSLDKRPLICSNLASHVFESKKLKHKRVLIVSESVIITIGCYTRMLFVKFWSMSLTKFQSKLSWQNKRTWIHALKLTLLQWDCSMLIQFETNWEMVANFHPVWHLVNWPAGTCCTSCCNANKWRQACTNHWGCYQHLSSLSTSTTWKCLKLTLGHGNWDIITGNPPMLCTRGRPPEIKYQFKPSPKMNFQSSMMFWNLKSF